MERIRAITAEQYEHTSHRLLPATTTVRPMNANQNPIPANASPIEKGCCLRNWPNSIAPTARFATAGIA